ncbi:toprim domain-containing protein [Methanococcoides orientis]|uniref:toprim domain-containing protein n=1 Tax=Methanococcoides orientis TaxID=2822137 RepID=UPI001E5BB171|nr:toprim domain-containing protein [Methanococcoides orientis]
MSDHEQYANMPVGRPHLKAPLFVYQRKLELIEELLEEMLEHSNNGDLIVVEGKRDVISLRKLGFQGDIELATHRPLTEVSARIVDTGKKVMVLTDWDRRGDLLASKISEDLRYFGIDVDMNMRERLSSMVKKEIKDVESLYSYVAKLRKIAGSSHQAV